MNNIAYIIRQGDRKIFEETKHTHFATHTWCPIVRYPWKDATQSKFLHRENPQLYGPPKKGPYRATVPQLSLTLSWQIIQGGSTMTGTDSHVKILINESCHRHQGKFQTHNTQFIYYSRWNQINVRHIVLGNRLINIKTIRYNLSEH